MVPVFAIPYVSLIPYIGIGLLVFLFFRVRVYRSAAVTMIIVWFISYAFYFFLQSYIARPAITGTDPFSAMVRSVYASISRTTTSRACTLRSQRSSRSTGGARSADRYPGGDLDGPDRGVDVLIKQHYLADVAGGLLLAGVISLIRDAPHARWLTRTLRGCGTMASGQIHTTTGGHQPWHLRLRLQRSPLTSCPAAPPPDRPLIPRHSPARDCNRGSGLFLSMEFHLLTILAVSPRSGGTAHSNRLSLTPPTTDAAAWSSVLTGACHRADRRRSGALPLSPTSPACPTTVAYDGRLARHRSGRRGAPAPRRSVLMRRAAGVATAGQAVAANIDLVFITVALGVPLRLRRIEPRWRWRGRAGGTGHPAHQIRSER